MQPRLVDDPPPVGTVAPLSNGAASSPPVGRWPAHCVATDAGECRSVPSTRCAGGVEHVLMGGPGSRLRTGRGAGCAHGPRRRAGRERPEPSGAMKAGGPRLRVRLLAFMGSILPDVGECPERGQERLLSTHEFLVVGAAGIPARRVVPSEYEYTLHQGASSAGTRPRGWTGSDRALAGVADGDLFHRALSSKA